MRTEPTLTTDNFNKPKVLKEYEAVYTLLVRLLLLVPGSIPGYPDMGVGLVKNYRFSGEDDLDDIRQRIASQITTYLPDYQSIDVQVSIEDSKLNLVINLDELLFEFTGETNNDGTLTLKDIENNNSYI